MHRVLAQGPYAIQGVLLIVEYWRPTLILDRLRVSQFAVWVRLQGFPLECLTVVAGFQLGYIVGDVLRVDFDEASPHNLCFLRVRIGHTLGQCDVSFELAQEEIDSYLIEVNQCLNSVILMQEEQAMYTANMRVFAYHKDWRNSTVVGGEMATPTGQGDVPMEGLSVEERELILLGIPTQEGWHNLDDFVEEWERNWDVGL
ncbi:hypothetical protein LOK49_LG15G01722 [Camellia lanceoleosa]|uniref:Uncharacterized protein n=1 Tax=Camellia lanceoleosa TaxID=1840588 RepID=A0ACC0F476_9ERIC|nr:hypothetical protein LOK49_LG15G01722 [Camellia lanceoleosa]